MFLIAVSGLLVFFLSLARLVGRAGKINQLSYGGTDSVASGIGPTCCTKAVCLVEKESLGLSG
jgi:hypothetical protein